MNKNQLKELVKSVMTEESEYQAFFKKALEKAGKSIPSMSDEEKKSFFDKIDAAWSGKGEKKEMKEDWADGDDTKNGKKPEETCPKCGKKMSMCECWAESVDEAKDANGNEFPELDDVKAAIKKMIQNNDVERLLKNKVIAYLQKEKRFDGAGNTNSMRLFDKVINDLLKH